MDLTFFKTAFHIYPESIQQDGELTCFMIDAGESDRLCVVGHHPSFPGEPLSQSGHAYTLSELNHAAAVFLREHFPFCAPAAVLDRKTTFGAGDRLGLAGPGLLRVFQEYDVFPVLAQQSVRELTLTRRTMDDVIDSASFAVFRAGYRRGFGVDGDHLKTLEEVREALAPSPSTRRTSGGSRRSTAAPSISSARCMRNTSSPGGQRWTWRSPWTKP